MVVNRSVGEEVGSAHPTIHSSDKRWAVVVQTLVCSGLQAKACTTKKKRRRCGGTCDAAGWLGDYPSKLPPTTGPRSGLKVPLTRSPLRSIVKNSPVILPLRILLRN